MSNSSMEVIVEEILEGTTPTITGVLTNKAGTAIPLANLTTITLTLYNLYDAAFAIINARDNQDIKNLSRVTIDSNGNLAWNLAPEDTQMQDEAIAMEVHRAVFKWTYTENSLAQVGTHVIDLKIRNLEKE